MHAALRIDDILSQIFGHIRDTLCVENPDISVYRRRDLATAYHAALVCKAFRPHALDALWFWMEELEPLFDLLPENIKYDDEVVFSTFVAPLHREDLNIFDSYARRIRACHYYEENGVRIDGKVPLIKQVLKCLTRACLLPNLQHIWVGDLELPVDPRVSDHSFCFLLFGSNLRIFEMSSPNHDELLYLLPQLSQTTPFLHHLSMSEVKMPPKLLRLIHLPSLRYFNTSGDFLLSQASFSSCFPFAATLEKWIANSLKIQDKDSSRGQSSAGSPLFHFPSLKELSLWEQPGVSILGDLFTFTLFPSLRRLNLTIKNEDNNDTFLQRLKSFFDLLFCRGNCLEELKVVWWDIGNAGLEEPTGIQLNKLFEGISPDQALLKLNLAGLLTLDSLSTSSIRHLAHTFPHLQTLHLATDKSALISFDDLALLGELLPGLLHLSLCGINAEDLPVPPTIPVLTHGLKTLCISGSKIGDPTIMARHIDRLFPFVGSPIYPSAPETEEERAVIFALALMKGCRKDEVARNGATLVI